MVNNKKKCFFKKITFLSPRYLISKMGMEESDQNHSLQKRIHLLDLAKLLIKIARKISKAIEMIILCIWNLIMNKTNPKLRRLWIIGIEFQYLIILNNNNKRILAKKRVMLIKILKSKN